VDADAAGASYVMVIILGHLSSVWRLETPNFARRELGASLGFDVSADLLSFQDYQFQSDSSNKGMLKTDWTHCLCRFVTSGGIPGLLGLVSLWQLAYSSIKPS
jgi:hypothetical protein